LLAAALAAVLASTYSVNALSRRIEAVQKLGQYTLEEKLGEGGMGTVYRARHAMLRRPTALKMLKAEALSDENLVRFEREVQLTAQLSHPSIIEIYDYGRTPEGIFYYVMEFLSGLTLAKLIDLESTVPAPRVIYILKHVCSALEQAHAIGLVHRDIKPLNIMLCRQGVLTDVVKVLDFGLVKDVSTPEELQVTSPEVVGGTPPYIAPERLKDPQNVDPKSDLFSVGGIAYNLLTGQPIFEGSTAMEICYKVLREDPRPPSEVLGEPIPSKLEALVMQCLSRDPETRPASAGAIVGMLESMPEAWQWGRVEARAWWEANGPKIGVEGASAPAAEEDDTLEVPSRADYHSSAT
jgi:serine/threonine-protein kinase